MFEGSRIHQDKNWYYSGPLQTSELDLFAKIVFDNKLLSFFVKGCNLDVWLVLKEASNKYFYILLVNILHLETKYLISTPVGLSLLFQEKMWLIKREAGGQGESF